MSDPLVPKKSDDLEMTLSQVDDRFEVRKSVTTLQRLMTDVTSKEINAQTVNAACNCVSQINNTMKTAIQAAKFLSGRW